MFQMILRYVGDILLYSVKQWKELADYFDGFLDDGKTFLRVKDHDNLLVDDETFSRSRKYFWALSCLSEFMLYISDAIHQWEVSRDVWTAAFDDYYISGQSKLYIKANDETCGKLRNIRDRMQHHHNNVTALRDGLFNASAVMESRASTRLGGKHRPQRPSLNILTHNRKRKAPHICQHLLPPSRLLHLTRKRNGVP
jgi:hypothetical protein